MDLYNFFTEQIKGSEKEAVKALFKAADEIKERFGNDSCYIKYSKETNKTYSIIGQVSKQGVLVRILAGIKYTWLNANCPQVNNLKWTKWD